MANCDCDARTVLERAQLAVNGRAYDGFLVKSIKDAFNSAERARSVVAESLRVESLKLAQVQADLKGARESLDRCSEVRDARQQQVGNLSNANFELRDEVRHLKAENEVIEKERERITVDLQRARQSIEALSDDLDASEEERQNCSTQLRDVKAEVIALKREKSDLTEANFRLSKDKKAYDNVVRYMQQIITSLGLEGTPNQVTIEEIIEKICHLKQSAPRQALDRDVVYKLGEQIYGLAADIKHQALFGSAQ